MKKVAAILLLLFIAGVTLYYYFPHFENDIRPYTLRKHPANNINTWSDALSRPLHERIGITPSFALEYIQTDSSVARDRSMMEPTATAVTFSSDVDDISSDARLAIDSLPDSIRSLFEKHVLGVVFVENLGSTGAAYIIPGHWRKTYGLIAIDSQKVSMPINEWYSSKVKSAFSGDSDLRLETILDEDETTRVSTLRFILLHEIGHIFAPAHGLEPPHYSGKDRMKYPFMQLSWKYYGRSIFDNQFQNRTHLKFYSDNTSLVPERELLETYEDLRDTNFISLYAATSNTEDIAELFAFYVHCMVLGKPHIVRIYTGDKLLFEMKNPIRERKFREKLDIIRKKIYD